MKYQGKDGWLHDQEGNTRRYHSRDFVDNPKAPRPPSMRPKLDNCPNCPHTVTWRKEQGYCGSCDWGKEQEDWDNYVAPRGSDGTNDGVLGICGLIGASVALCFVGSGIGFAVGGAGGLIAGLGLGMAFPVAFIFWVVGGGTERK